MSNNNNSGISRAILLATVFCLPLCGTLTLFFFLAALQLSFVVSCFFIKQPSIKQILQLGKANYPWASYLFAAWFLISIVSLLLALTADKSIIAKLAAITRQLFIILQALFFLGTAKLITSKTIKLEHIFYSFLAGFSLIVAVHFTAIAFGPSPASSSYWMMTPLLAANIRDIGNLAEAASLLSLAFFVFHPKANMRKAFFVLLIISSSYVIWTGGRASIAFTAISIAIFIAAFILYQGLCKRLLWVLVALLIAGFINTQINVFYWNGIIRYQQVSQQVEAGKIEITNGRTPLWEISLDAIKEKPLLGQGPYSFFFLEERIKQNILLDQPHNIFLQTLLEWGVIGSLLFFAGLLSCIFNRKNFIASAFNQGDATTTAALGVILILASRSLTGGALWNYQSVVVFVLAMLFMFQPRLTSPSSFQKHR